MSWGVFVIAAWIALACEWGLRGALAIGSTAISPSFVLVLAVFIAMWASSMHALFGCLVLGLGLDLLLQIPAGEGMRVVVGPHALGLLLMGYTVVTSRSLVFRKNIQSGVFLTLLGGMLVAIVATALISVRGAMYDDIEPGRGTARLVGGLGSAAASAVLALVMIPLLSLVSGVFGFRKASAPEFGTRR